MGPTGPAGWVQGPPTPARIPHPLRPLQGLRGLLRWECWGGLFSVGGHGITHPVYPPGYTHPVPYPGYTSSMAHPAHAPRDLWDMYI